MTHFEFKNTSTRPTHAWRRTLLIDILVGDLQIPLKSLPLSAISPRQDFSIQSMVIDALSRQSIIDRKIYDEVSRKLDSFGEGPMPPLI